MVDVTWVNIKTIRSMDMEFTNGLMEDFTSVIGCVENNMVSVFTRLLKLISNMVFGKKVKELNGMTINKLRKSQMATKTSDNISKSQRTNKHKYMDRLINPITSTINCRKYKRDSVLLLTISLIEEITAVNIVPFI